MVAHTAGRRSLLELTPAQLAEVLAEVGEPKYRARQVYQWVHKQGVIDPHAMNNLPGELREFLAERFGGRPLKYKTEVASSDGSIKYAWMTPQVAPVEAVLMPGFDYGTVLCVSCQSGCALKCRFCLTGRLGLLSQLTAGQMLAQLYDAEARSQQTVERLVFMGMGEPLLNLGEVRKVIDTLMSADGREWSARRFTISTVGLIKPMLEMARTFPRVNLALSLHFTTDDKRIEHMPGAESDLDKLAEALAFYRRYNGGKVTVEYALLDRLNDHDRDAKRLIGFARLSGVNQHSELMVEALEAPEPARQQALPLHVNLITYNAIKDAPRYKRSDDARVNEFAKLLSDANVPVTVRHSRGADIGAACGQLGAQLLEGRH